MSKLDRAQYELREMDALAAGDSPLHRLHPLSKLFMTIAYVAVVVSFQKYDLTGMAPLLLCPVLLYQLADIPVSTCFRKLRVVLPLVCAVGIVNPFMDTAPILRVGGVPVSGGVISMLTLMLKGVLSLMMSFLLIATTPIDTLCAGLRKLRVPPFIVTLFLLTYRYVALMIREVAVMSEAYALRAPGQKGIHISAWGSFLGQLLLRSMDRAQEIHSGMRLRGFNGDFYYADLPAFGAGDAAYILLAGGFIALCRCVNIIGLFGGLFAR